MDCGGSVATIHRHGLPQNAGNAAGADHDFVGVILVWCVGKDRTSRDCRLCSVFLVGIVVSLMSFWPPLYIKQILVTIHCEDCGNCSSVEYRSGALEMDAQKHTSVWMRLFCVSLVVSAVAFFSTNRPQSSRDAGVTINTRKSANQEQVAARRDHLMAMLMLLLLRLFPSPSPPLYIGPLAFEVTIGSC